MRLATSAAAAFAALVMSIGSASACCGSCGCGYQPTYYAPATVYQPVTTYQPVTVYAPVQRTYAVNQGPVYQVPAATAEEPVPEYVDPPVGYGYGYGRRYGYGYGYRYGGYRGGYRGGYAVRRAAFGLGYRGGYRGYGGRYHR